MHTHVYNKDVYICIIGNGMVNYEYVMVNS